MNHTKHTWLRPGTVLPHAAVESGASQNESAAAEAQARGRGMRVRITHFQSIGLRPPGSGSGAAETHLFGFLSDSKGLPHPPEPATWNLETLDHGTKSLVLNESLRRCAPG